MKPSPFYPSKPWPITNITNHPAYALLRKSGEDDDSSAAVFYDIAAFATLVKGDPDRYRAGAPLSELANLEIVESPRRGSVALQGWVT